MKLLFAFSLSTMLTLQAIAGTGKEIASYNRLVNKAELAIVHGDLKMAAACYEEAFRYRQPFASDACNAAVCAMELGQKERAMRACGLMAQRGVGGKLFSKAVFAPLRGEAGWAALIRRADAVRDSLARTGQALNSRMDRLFEADQAFGHYRHQLLAAGGPSINDSISHITDSFTAEFLKIVQTVGFPDEGLLGAAVKNDTMLSGYRTYTVIFTHGLEGSGWLYAERLRSLLLSAIDSGLIQPAEVARLSDFNGVFQIHTGELNFILAGCSVYRRNLPDDILFHINQLRGGLQLCSLAEREEKIVWLENHPHSDYVLQPFGGFTVRPEDMGDNQSALRGLLEDATLLVKRRAGCKE